MRGRDSALRDVRNWSFLVNPWEPSWGEPFRSIADRMIAAMTDAADSVDVGRRRARQPPAPDLDGAPPRRPASRSRTTRAAAAARSRASRRFERRGGRFVEVDYRDPAVRLAAQATDLGAV